jgi:hypothetical protein
MACAGSVNISMALPLPLTVDLKLNGMLRYRQSLCIGLVRNAGRRVHDMPLWLV